MATCELILGGQRSGKSRCAESRAVEWLTDSRHSAVLLATAVAGDEEMRLRIARHRADRAVALPRMATLEVPRDLSTAIDAQSAPECMVVVDCLTLWLTNLLMPLEGAAVADDEWARAREALCATLAGAAGPVVLVSNEIGLGVTPLGREGRRFVDELGRLHQTVAAGCDKVTLMVAGIEVPVRRSPT